MIRHGMRERATQGFLTSEAAEELADTLELLEELRAVGAVSDRFADDLIVALAEEQAELWREAHGGLPLAGVA